MSPFLAIVVAVPDYYSRQCGRGFWICIITVDSIRIWIVMPDSIRYSIRMQTADSQVSNSNYSITDHICYI